MTNGIIKTAIVLGTCETQQGVSWKCNPAQLASGYQKVIESGPYAG